MIDALFGLTENTAVVVMGLFAESQSVSPIISTLLKARARKPLCSTLKGYRQQQGGEEEEKEEEEEVKERDEGSWW